MRSRVILQGASMCSRCKGLAARQNAKHLNKLLPLIVYENEHRQFSSFCRKFKFDCSGKTSMLLEPLFILTPKTYEDNRFVAYSTQRTEHGPVDFTNVLLEDIAIRLSDNNYSFANVPLLIRKIESSIYNTYAFQILCDSPHLRQNQILYHVFHKHLEKKFYNNMHLEQIIKVLQLNLVKIEVIYLPIILSAFMPLLGPHHQLIQKVCDICNENIEIFELPDIVNYLQAAANCLKKYDYNTQCKISEIIQKKICDKCVPFSDLSTYKTVCEIYQSLGVIMNEELFQEGLTLVMNTNENLWIDDPVSSLNAFSKFPFGAKKNLDEDTKEKISELALKLNTVDIDLTQLDLDSCLFISTVLDPVLRYSFLQAKRWEMTKSFIENNYCDEMDFNLLLKVSLLFFSTDTSPNVVNKFGQVVGNDVTQDVLRQLSRLVDHCDLFWLLKLLKVSTFGKMPSSFKYSIHQKFEDVLDSYCSDHIDWLLNETKEELFLDLAMLSYDNKYKITNELMEKMKIRVKNSTGNEASSKTSPFVLVLQILDQALCNGKLSFSDLNLCINMIFKIDFQGLSYLATKLKTVIMKNSFPPILKTKIKKLNDKITEEIHGRLQDPYTIFDQLSSSSFPSVLSENDKLHPDLISSLTQLSSSLNKKNCLFVINLLGSISDKNPYYLPETFENLLKIVYQSELIPPHSFLSLLRLISMAGYQPEDADHFTSFCVQMQQSILECNSLDVIQRLEMMFYLSLMEINNNVHNFFTIDNLICLDKEINNFLLFNPYLALTTKNYLFQLTRNVIVECPYLPLQQYVEIFPSWDGSPERKNLCKSLRRVYDSPLVVQDTSSPYGHPIDALVHFEWDGFAYQLKDVHDALTDTVKQSYLVAVLYLSHKDFCKETDSFTTGSCNHLTGSAKANIRQLQLLGYTVIDVPYRRLQMMDLQSENALDEFLMRRIEVETGIHEMFD